MIFSQVVPFAVYPLLHDTAVQDPVDVQDVHVPFATEIAEQETHEEAPEYDHFPYGQFVHEVEPDEDEYVPAEHEQQ